MDCSVLGNTIEIDESFVDEPQSVIRAQIAEYERGDRRRFDLTVRSPDDTTGAVMDAMNEIPYGETRSYATLADALDTAPIAIGAACARNPVPVIVPCHRVVGSDGSLTGYSGGDGVPTKHRLLEFESRTRRCEPVQTRLFPDSCASRSM